MNMPQSENQRASVQQSDAPEHVHLQDLQVQQRELVIWRYWPDVQGMHIGYANSKRFLLLIALLLGAAVCTLVLDWFFHLGLGALIAIVVIVVLFSRMYRTVTRYNGYYELDEQGNPVRFLGNKSADIAHFPLGRPVSRARFLRSIRG